MAVDMESNVYKPETAVERRPMPSLAYVAVTSLVWLPVMWVVLQLFFP